MKVFNCLFKLPEKEEFIIAAYAAVCAYTKRLKDANFPVHTTLIAKETWLTDLIIPVSTFMVESIEEVKGQYFDIALDLTEDRAIELGKTGRNAASAYGVLMGVENTPELVHIKASLPSNDLCILPWGLKSLEMRHIEAQGLKTMILNGQFDSLSKVKAALSSKVVVGKRSVYTYLAACAGRTILEGYPMEEYDKDLFTKWSNSSYHVICTQTLAGLDKNIEVFDRSLERILLNAR